MLPVPGLRFLRHRRPGTAEVSFVTSSVWVIGRRRSSNLTVINAVIAVLRWNGTSIRSRQPRCLGDERWPWSRIAGTALLYARVSVPSPLKPASCTDPCLPRLLLDRLSGTRPARPLDGVIGPQDGEPRSPCRNGGGETFFPWAAPIPREPRKSLRRHPPLRCGPKGCVGDRLRPVDRHRGRDGRGLEQPRRDEMATIGSFKKSSSNEFQGEIVTLSVQAKGVRIVPETNRTSDNAPSHRVFVGRAEIGAAWSKRSSEGRDYLSVKLDDPSFTTPIYANLFDDEGGETFSLIWSRGRRSNGD